MKRKMCHLLAFTTLTLLILFVSVPTIFAKISTISNGATTVSELCKELGSALYNKITENLGTIDPANSLILCNAEYLISSGYSLYPVLTPFINAGFHPLYSLIPVHSPFYSNLWIFAYRDDTHKATYIEVDKEIVDEAVRGVIEGRSVKEAVSDILNRGIVKESIFTIDLEKMITKGKEDPEAVWSALEENTSKTNAFSISTITTMWKHRAPHEVLLAGVLHNHICPGLVSGILMINYLTKMGYIGPNTKIYILASPVWCKDDAFIQLLDATPGKRRMVVKLLTKEEENMLKEKFGADVAGIVFVMMPDKTGKAYIMAFNWDKACELANIERKMFKGKYWWWTRVVMNLKLLEYLEKPEELVSIVKTMEVKGYIGRYPQIYYNASLAGADPYVVTELISKITETPSTTTTPSKVPELTSIILIVCVIIIIALAAALAYLYTKRK